MKQALIVIACIVAFSIPSHAHACGVGSSGNITCTQITDLSGGLCSGTLSAFVTPTNVGDILIAWTDNDSTSAAMSVLHDQVNGNWTKVMTSKGWNTNGSPTNFDTVWMMQTTTTSALNFTTTCQNSYEIRIAEFHSSVGTVAVDCASAWTAFDNPASNMTTSCNATMMVGTQNRTLRQQ